MTVLDFIFGTILLIVILIMFISWLDAKYDIVGKNEENQLLREELRKQIEKEIKMKNKDKIIKRSSKSEVNRSKPIRRRTLKDKSKM